MSNLPRPLPIELPPDTVGRFWEKVERRDPESCWPWKGGASRGYGHFRLDGRLERVVKAHRMVWTLTHGPIPYRLLVLHRCDRPRCCNPSHLWLGTYADNTADMLAKGRQRKSRKVYA